MALNRDQIIKVGKPVVKEVPTPNWGGSVFIRVMSGAERCEFVETFRNEPEGEGRAWKLIVRNVCTCVCDEEGARIFNDGDEPLLLTKDYKTLADLSAEILKFNGLAEKSIEDAEKNSDASQS